MKKKKTMIKKNETNSNNSVPKRKVKVPSSIKYSYDYSTFSQMISTALDGTENHLNFIYGSKSKDQVYKIEIPDLR